MLRNDYIGQPFSVLLKDLPDTIRYFYPIHEFENVTPPKASIFAFGFIDYQQVQQNFFDSKFSYYKRALVHISWQSPLKLDDIKHFLIENNNWNSQTEQFFAPLIVQDIEIGEPVEVSKAGGWLHWP